MNSVDIRKKFTDYFIRKGHTLVPSSSLVPDDPSVLLTTAGMQQFKQYYTELDPVTTVHPSIQKPVGRNACSIQKSFRTSDIDEVGDERHLTFFEMLGNFSFGGYFKKEAIEFAHEFITDVMGINISYVTVFRGSDMVPKDEESKKIWNSLGISDVREGGMEDVFWGPTGASGPCGPTTEIYCKNAAGEDIEIWNIVFNQYLCSGSREQLLTGTAQLSKLETPGVDTGMGLERLAMVSQEVKNVFETDLFVGPFSEILSENDQKSARIVADHYRATVFLIADGVEPSNKDRGYILRRIIRHMIVHAHLLGRGSLETMLSFLEAVVSKYSVFYNNLRGRQAKIYEVFKDEYFKFTKNKRYPIYKLASREPFQVLEKTRVVGADAFDLYQSYGLTPDILKDLLIKNGYEFDAEAFSAEFRKHQEVSKAGATGKFGGHGLILSGELKASNEDEVKRVTRMHTATHMLHQALRTVLGDHVHQQGSDITPERLRFDFMHPKKLTTDEIAAVEEIVNDNIVKDHMVSWKEMPFTEAQKAGALAFFKEKYPETVKVYSIGDFSKEVCGGPHVTHTAEIGHFTIVKEEAVSAGVRRIRAIVEP